MGEDLAQALAAVIAESPEAIALIDAADATELSYSELGQRLAAVAEYLDSAGVRPQEIVSLVADNSLSSALFLLGTICAGRIVNPIAPTVTEQQLLNLLDHSGAVLVVAQPGWQAPSSLGVPCCELPASLLSKTTDWRAPVVRRSSGALLVYTSGTLGAPKGVLLSHGNILANVATALECLPFRADHRTLTVLPLFHTFAVISDLLTMLLSGRACVIGETFDLKKLPQLQRTIERHRVRSFSAAPLIFDLMLKLNLQLPRDTLAFCVAGAAPLSAELTRVFSERYGVPIVPAYGMTETSCFATISPFDEIRPGSCGKPAGCSIRVADDAGQPAATGQIGELMISGESVMVGGYFKSSAPAYDVRDVTGALPWLCTGDLGYLDRDGYLFIVGRKKNMVIRGGEKVYLEELDTALARMPGVLDAASVGVPRTPIDGIVTFVVQQANSELSASDVFAYLRKVVGDGKCPDRVAFAAHIPRTPSNKVRTMELRSQAEQLLS
jgi:acyl-CoA synthetase (AMP-forming)/AMP-acid ligase II